MVRVISPSKSVVRFIPATELGDKYQVISHIDYEEEGYWLLLLSASGTLIETPDEWAPRKES